MTIYDFCRIFEAPSGSTRIDVWVVCCFFLCCWGGDDQENIVLRRHQTDLWLVCHMSESLFLHFSLAESCWTNIMYWILQYDLALAIAEEPCLEKAKKMKKPAAPVKKPAAKTSTASSKATTWQPSASFGFLKCTKATEKSYIQAKPDLSAKPYCLVNVQGSGVDHAAVVDQLME